MAHTPWPQLASVDIYVIDQILRGRIQAGMRVCSLGCGYGRNLGCLIDLGCDVEGLDINPNCIAECQRLYPSATFHSASISETKHYCQQADVVLANALFHFAPNGITWLEWVQAAWECVKPGGMFFARLATKIGLPQANPPGFGYLADIKDIESCEDDWQALRVDPLKTTLVEDKRTMTTWVLHKPG